MTSYRIKIASCQFAVGTSIRRNARTISRFLHQAKKAHAHLVHFPECALSGYCGFDRDSTDNLDWPLLHDEMKNIMQLTARLKLWVVLGSTHRLTWPHKPHNSLYLLNPRGKIVDRYDKRFCTESDLCYFSPGNRFVVFSLNGVKCALLICFDLRFPEIYRALKKLHVSCIFQSFYNARQDGPSLHTHIMRQTMQGHAANNYFWISMVNSSAYYSPYPSCFIQPDGKIARQLRFHRPGMMLNTVDLKQKFYDPMRPFRDLAMAGTLSNGPKINDPRSSRTDIL